MRIAYSLSCLAAYSCLASAAFAADNPTTVLEVSGKALVTNANGVVPLEVGQTVAEGDSIFVGDDSAVRLAAANGNCNIILPSSKITVINTRKLCKVKITPTASHEPVGGLPPPVVGLGFFAAVVGTAAIVTITDDKSVSAP